MISEIRMPQFGVTMDFGTIAEWHKHVGDTVSKGDVLLTIETEKLTNDVEAEADGVILAIVAEEGDEVPVQGLLGAIGEAGEVWTPETEAAPAEEAAPAVEEKPAEAAPADAKPAALPADGRVIASPLAKKRAKELGVDLTKLRGTGTTGRIKEKDVIAGLEIQKAERLEAEIAAKVAEALAKLQPVVAAAEPAKPEEKPLPLMEGDSREKMSAARRVIAKRMTESIVKAPQVTLTHEVNADALLAFHRELKAKYPEKKVSVNDILIKLLASALAADPALNVSVDGDYIIRHQQINVGVAVALDDSLLVPVVKNADKKSLMEISAETKQLISDCRSGCIAPDALTGGTVSISNLGSFGVDGFTPIVNLPEAAILGVGRAMKKAIVMPDDSIKVANTMMLSLSFDHRAVDGATASRLLKSIASMIEEPLFALL